MTCMATVTGKLPSTRVSRKFNRLIVPGSWTTYIYVIFYCRSNISMSILGIVAPWIAGIFLEKKWLGRVTVRRIGGILCSLAGIPLILMGTLSCSAVEDSIIPLLIMSSIRGGWYISITPTIMDLQKEYQNQLVTFS